jgi:hypothetical protein
MSEIPNENIPKVESIYTKENGWKIILDNAKQFLFEQIEKATLKEKYQGSIFIGSSNEYPEFQGYKRLIRVSGIVGINDFVLGKRNKTALGTTWDIQSKKAYIGYLKNDFTDFTGEKEGEQDRLDLSDKVKCDNFINAIVKDKPQFYIRMLDQMRSTYTKRFSRETKRNMMAVIETAIEMGSNGTNAFLSAKEIDPNTIPTNIGTGTTDGTGTGTGTGTSTSPGTPIQSNVPLIGLALVGLGLLFTNSKKNKK